MSDESWCASCTKRIEGEPKVVKGKVRAQTFHQTPEDCASAPTQTIVYTSWGNRGRTNRAGDNERSHR